MNNVILYIVLITFKIYVSKYAYYKIKIDIRHLK